MAFQLLKLVAEETNKYQNKGIFPCRGTFDILPLRFNNNLMIKECDIIKDLYLYVYLPKLQYGLHYRDDLLSHIITLITINIDYYNGQESAYYNIYHNTVKTVICNELADYSNKLLYRNLDEKTKIKMSSKGFTLILPLVLNTKMSPLISDINIIVNLNKSNLIENYPEYKLDDLTYEIKGLCGFYKTNIRNEMIQLNKL